MTITRFGPHAVTQGSITGGQVDDLMADERALVLYSDPPWGDQYLRMFATHTEKATGVRPVQPAYLDLCARYADLLDRYVTEWAFIEVGIKAVDPMLDAVRPHLTTSTVVPMKYGDDLSAVIIVGRKSPGPLPNLQVEGLKGLPFVKHVLGTVATPGAVVLDPCCGAGYTAKGAVFHGMRFRGNELNPARLDKTKAYLASVTG